MDWRRRQPRIVGVDDAASSQSALRPPASPRLAPSRLERALHLGTLRRRILAAITVGWLPFVLLGLAERLFHGTNDLLLADPAAHVRILIALPLLLLAEHDLEARCHTAIRRLNEQGFVPNEQRQTLATVVQRAAACRDALVAEVLLIATAYAGSVAVVFGASPLDATAGAHWSAARLWYGLCALPLYQLIVFRGLWRWAWWARVLVALSRLRLRLIATHPDRRGGIGFLKTPSLRFFALFLMALSCTFSATWATRLAAGTLTTDAVKNLFAIYFCIGLAFAYAPLFLFSLQLDRLKHEGELAFGGLSVDYVERFEARWLWTTKRPEPLGDPDFQSLADLGNTYRGTIRRVRRSLVDGSDVLLLLAFAAAPLVPLALLRMPFAALVSEMFRLALGQK